MLTLAEGPPRVWIARLEAVVVVEEVVEAEQAGDDVGEKAARDVAVHVVVLQLLAVEHHADEHEEVLERHERRQHRHDEDERLLVGLAAGVGRRAADVLGGDHDGEGVCVFPRGGAVVTT